MEGLIVKLSLRQNKLDFIKNQFKQNKKNNRFKLEEEINDENIYKMCKFVSYNSKLILVLYSKLFFYFDV